MKRVSKQLRSEIEAEMDERGFFPAPDIVDFVCFMVMGLGSIDAAREAFGKTTPEIVSRADGLYMEYRDYIEERSDIESQIKHQTRRCVLAGLMATVEDSETGELSTDMDTRHKFLAHAIKISGLQKSEVKTDQNITGSMEMGVSPAVLEKIEDIMGSICE